MSEADKMFEELGYEKWIDSRNITHFIHKKKKKDFTFMNGNCYSIKRPTKKEQIAINKKVEELRMDKIILSLFDYTGNWSKYYRENGYKVIQIDLQHGQDILTWNYKDIDNVYGILASVPCTDFALSGARHFARKDQDGTTEYSKKLVYKTLEIIDYFKPKFWCVENPMSRIHKVCPELRRSKI